MTLPVQVSGKCGDIIVVIGGNTPAEFQDNAMAILGPDAMDSIGDAFKAALVAGAEMGVMTKAQDVVIAAGMANTTSADSGPASSQEAVTTPQVPATNPNGTSPKTETDKFNRTFTYSVPGAPSCAHGPTVKMDAKGKEPPHRPYTKWVCPTQTPFAYRQRIQKQVCEGGGFAK